MPKLKKALHFGLSSFSGLEKDLSDWVMECRWNGFIVTRSSIRIYALQMTEQFIDGITEFKAMAGWCTCFLYWCGLCLRQGMKIKQKLPKDLEEKISLFKKFIIKQRQNNNFDLSNIGNMDETPMTFHMPGNRTVAGNGEKTVLVKTTGHVKMHSPLCCLAWLMAQNSIQF